MDPRYSAQDIIHCNLCETSVVQSHCELCSINLCKSCVGEHLSDSSSEHRVVPYRVRSSTPKYPPCPTHGKKHCEMYCEKCDVSVCSNCIASGKHQGHQITDVLQKISSKREDIEKDLNELQERISPTYKHIVQDIQTEKAGLEKQYEEVTAAVTTQGENWLRKINIAVKERKAKISQLKIKHKSVLNEQEEKITNITSEINQCIFELKKILASNEVSLALAYKSRNAKFTRVPPKVKVSVPSFSPKMIDTEQLHQLFGPLQEDLVTTEKDCHIMAPDAVSPPLTKPSSSLVKPPLIQPKVITAICTRNTNSRLRSITCLTDEEIWTCWDNKIMKLYNLQGILLKSIQTKSRNKPSDIEVTKTGELVYTDPDSRTINVVKDKNLDVVKEKDIHTGIRLQKWRPVSVCSTSSGDLLATLLSNDGKRSKVVRYSDFSKTQSIKSDDQSKPLYSNGDLKHIRENKNLDICVSDNKAKAVVVVNQAGKLRFRYTGHPFIFPKERFNPLGITTDSQAQILIADGDNNCIHVLDKDGQFIQYIDDNCDLVLPWGLCVDTSNNLIVGEVGGRVKKIKYR